MLDKTDKCPCCGQPLPSRPLSWSRETRTVTRDGRAIRLSPRQADYFDAIWSARRPMSGAEIMDRVHADDPSGGPESFHNAYVNIHFLNRRLKPLRAGVRSRGNQHHSYGYKLVVLDAR